MKMKNFLNKEFCGAKNFYGNLNLGFHKNLNAQMHYIVKLLIGEEGYRSINDITKVANKLTEIEDGFFESVFDKEEKITDFVEELNRIYISSRTAGYKVDKEHKGGHYNIQVGNDLVSVNVDFYLKDLDGRVYAVMFDFGSAKGLTKKVDSAGYYLNDVRFELIRQATQMAYPDEVIYPAILFYKSSSSSKAKPFDFGHFYYADVTNELLYSEAYLQEKLLSLSKVQSTPQNKALDQNKCIYCSYRNLCNLEKDDNEGLEIVTEIKKAEKDVKFTDAQDEVINFNEGEMRVLAGAGSGKTTCLANNVARKISQGAYAKDFLLLTFTEKGAKEMKEKIEYWVKKYGSKKFAKIKATTFNGFGQEIIEKHYDKLGYSEKPFLIDDILAYDILYDLRDQGYVVKGYSYNTEKLFYGNRKDLTTLLNVISIYKEELAEKGKGNTKRAFDQLCDLKKGETYDFDMIHSFEKVVEKYNEILKEENLIDYSDQIQLCLKALQMKEVNKEIKYKHIIVDEFQDTSLVQLKIVQELYHKGKGNSLLVCGDDAQAIFGFRGVGPENIIGFKYFYPETKDVYMVDNFRSTNEVIDLANRVIKLNKNQIKKNLIAHKNGEDVKILKSLGSYPERIADIVEEELNKGAEYNEICVLAATRLELVKVRKALRERGIPTALSVAEKYIEDSGIIGAYSLASFIRDNEFLQGLMTFDVAVDPEYRYTVSSDKLLNEADEVLKEIELLDDEERFNWFMNRLNLLPQTIALCEIKKYFEDKNINKFTDVSNYLNKIVLYNSNKMTEADTNNYMAVNLSTVHASKGREFKIVILSDEKMNTVEYGKVDSSQAITPIFEEERIRLLYVAITRAKEKLYVIQQYDDTGLKELKPFYYEADFKLNFGRKKIERGANID